jgi:uncharacterized membrane protein YfcA
MIDLSLQAWILAIAAAISAGLSKSGFGPFGLLTIIFMAEVVPALESTGVVLPLLIFADLMAVRSYHEHASWKTLRALLPATLVGIITGWWLMPHIPTEFFGHTLGWIILTLIGIIILQRSRPQLLTVITSHPLLGLAPSPPSTFFPSATPKWLWSAPALGSTSASTPPNYPLATS